MQRHKTVDDVFHEVSGILTGDRSNYSFRPFSLSKTLRRTLGKTFPHWGSMRGKAMRAPFTVKIDSNYDYFYSSADPDLLFEKTEGLAEEVRSMISALSDTQATAYESFMTDTFAELIFGSNYIEKAGLGHEVTIRICKEIFEGTIEPSSIELRTEEYEAALEQVIANYFETKVEAVIRSRKEIVQHALALKYIINEIVALNNPLSETIITQTHAILTDGIKAPDGEHSATYSGLYRTCEVSAGFNTFTSPSSVPEAMAQLVADFNRDITTAEDTGTLDAYALAAKYCHKFVNIHPFVDGNGRTCRLILNSILLKYAGIVVALGEKEEDRDKYLEIASKGSMNEQVEEEERDRVPWGELATFVLAKGTKKMKQLRNILKGGALVDGEDSDSEEDEEKSGEGEEDAGYEVYFID